MASKPFDTFCGQVCSVIRWKPARLAAWAELEAHLEDHAAALEEQGVPADLAAQRAVEAMGDPYELGHQLDRCHSPLVPKLSRIFVLLALAVLLLSLIIGYRNDTGASGYAHFSTYYEDALLGSTAWLRIVDPTPGARKFTVTLSSTEESVTIYITLQEEVPPS